ncbi:MAG: hypothetical protein AB7S38_05915 [Vulcanimicrobiota bacterium]
MRVWVLVSLILLGGCYQQQREDNLRQAVEVVQSVLAKPEFEGKTAEQKLDFLFSPEAQTLWPPRPEAELNDASAKSGQQPSRILYLRTPDAPWSVVVRVQDDHLMVEGYGASLAQPEISVSLK